MHPTSLGQPAPHSADFHSVEGGWQLVRERLLLPHHPPQVFLRYCEEPFELAYPVFADVTGPVGGPCPVKEPEGFLMVCLGDVEGVFEGGVVLERRFFIHANSVVLIPG